MSSVVLFLSDLNLNRNKRTDFLRTLNMKFHEKLSGGTRIVACGWTDRRDEASILCSPSERTQNQLDALISQIYFWNKTVYVSESSLSVIRRF